MSEYPYCLAFDDDGCRKCSLQQVVFRHARLDLGVHNQLLHHAVSA